MTALGPAAVGAAGAGGDERRLRKALGLLAHVEDGRRFRKFLSRDFEECLHLDAPPPPPPRPPPPQQEQQEQTGAAAMDTSGGVVVRDVPPPPPTGTTEASGGSEGDPRTTDADLISPHLSLLPPSMTDMALPPSLLGHPDAALPPLPPGAAGPLPAAQIAAARPPSTSKRKQPEADTEASRDELCVSPPPSTFPQASSAEMADDFLSNLAGRCNLTPCSFQIRMVPDFQNRKVQLT
jgi:hypothetical protein